MTISLPFGSAILYVYPGADKGGKGRGKLGSVHQGKITLIDASHSGVAFYYDYSSASITSQRCSQTVLNSTILIKISSHYSLNKLFIEFCHEIERLSSRDRSPSNQYL